jgi:hypothetical protein
VSLLGLLLVDFLALVLLLWVLNLVRVGRLYVGYGVLLVLVLVGGAITVSAPALAARVGSALGALFPSPSAGVALLGLAFLLTMLVYVLSQVTVLANRLSTLVQELALERARRGSKAAPRSDTDAALAAGDEPAASGRP